MPTEDPRGVWLSPNFRLSDFLGNHSVYSSGYCNAFEGGESHIRNAETLCEFALEPALEMYGPLSVAYGYISPGFSRRTVKYQDPEKPSHHRWDLGAAADIRVHNWVDGRPLVKPDLAQLFMDENTRTSPIALAHAMDSEGVPYSRIITYSESPFVCVALSAVEVERNQPRGAFYENRYQGQPRSKPEYIQMSNGARRQRNLTALQEQGLEHDWRGAGHPTYHGGGRRQYQHTQVSRYTTLLDWLFNLQSISRGIRNVPSIEMEGVLDSLAAAGLVYDFLLDATRVRRLSILAGYTSRRHPDHDSGVCWHRAEWISIEVGAPRDSFIDGFCDDVASLLPDTFTAAPTDYGVRIGFSVEEVLDGILG